MKKDIKRLTPKEAQAISVAFQNKNKPTILVKSLPKPVR